MSQDPVEQPLPSPSVIGEYRLIRHLGTGGMGSVWLAEHVVLGKKFALKFLNQEYASHPEARSRFEQEARTIGGLDHPNIVSAVNFGFAADGRPYLVLEALVGRTVRELLNETIEETRRPLVPARAVTLIRQACAGIGHAHDCGIIHRDLKPENLFLASTNAGELQTKVLDFGIAKLRGNLDNISSHKTQTGVVLGTPYYMSPEQARGERDIDFRTDIYSLAAILYELLSGTKPHHGDQYNALIADIITREATPLDETALQLPVGLADVVAKGMARVRSERYQTPGEFSNALAPFPYETLSRGYWDGGARVEIAGKGIPTIDGGAPSQPSSSNGYSGVLPGLANADARAPSCAVQPLSSGVPVADGSGHLTPDGVARDAEVEGRPATEPSIVEKGPPGRALPTDGVRQATDRTGISAVDSLGPAIHDVRKKPSTLPIVIVGAFCLAGVGLYLRFAQRGSDSSAPTPALVLSVESLSKSEPATTATASDTENLAGPTAKTTGNETIAPKSPATERLVSPKIESPPKRPNPPSPGTSARKVPTSNSSRQTRDSAAPTVEFPKW